jgi:transglutaminase-like putative cysteine protease
MNRRDFLRLTGFVSASLAFPRWKFVLAEDSSPAGWRTFDVTTLVEVVKPSGTTRVWLPTALLQDTPFQKTISNRFDAPGGTVELVERKADALGIVRATFAEGARPVLTLTSRVQTRDYAVDLSKPGTAPKASRSELAHFLQPTALMPTDGIVKQTALEATKGATTDVEKAKAIYEWIVENTYRNPKTRGCGVGDIKFMLESKDLGGKCADLNALYVGLARASGLPARHIYGLRVAKSDLGFQSLGPSTGVCTKGQHCRAEVWLENFGWVPVDPADVRKVVLEERGGIPLNDPTTQKARAKLFGQWEMNWLAYNYAHDVKLLNSREDAVAFFMYPNAETGEARKDSLDPDSFKYKMTTRELGI